MANGLTPADEPYVNILLFFPITQSIFLGNIYISVLWDRADDVRDPIQWKAEENG